MEGDNIMTLQELIDKLTELNNYDTTKLRKSEVSFFAEDDYNTCETKIENVEVDEVEGKIYLS